MSTFEYNAPQFVDFNAGIDDDSDETDTFFDVEDSPKAAENKENEPEVSTVKVKQEVISPIIDKIKSELHVQEDVRFPKGRKSESPKKREIRKGLRRLTIDKQTIASSELKFSGKELSVNTNQNIDTLAIKKEIKTPNKEVPTIKVEEKLHPMTTRSDTLLRTPKLDLSSMVVVKEENNRKRKASSRPSGMPGKFVAMAEHALQFQKNTPPRFHSSRRTSSGTRKDLLKARMSYKPQRTVPVTPKLMTKLRSRPSIMPSMEEREKMELEEMKKHQVKAAPLNEKVLQPPKPLLKSEKPPTVQEPFKLTQVLKKPAPKEETYVFTAKPVPRKLLEKPVGLPPKVEMPVTVPQPLNITKPRHSYKPPIRVPAFSNDSVTQEDVYGFGVNMKKVTRPRNTEVKPFSFEERELEKKERKKQERAQEMKQSFRAKSPRVLRKNPFKPILEHSHSQPPELTLNTERRIQERRQFEIQQQMREEQIAYEKEQMALEKARKEEEEIARLRQEAVHKARPMPTFKTPVKCSSQLPLTEPKSPRFAKRTRTTTVSD